MTYQSLLVVRDGAVATVTLNRPTVRNAFNDTLIAELTRWAVQAATDSTLRCVVLAGAGSHFCAGADLAWMAKAAAFSREENVQDADAASTMLAAIDNLPMAVIGRVHGGASGGGCGLAAVCDAVVATDDTVFGFTETKLGLVAAVISPYVTRKIGYSAARHLMVTGARFSAEHAKDIGLVHAVVAPDELDTRVSQYVRECLTSAPGAIAATKSLLHDVAGRSPEEVRRVTTTTLADRRASAEGQHGVRAFLDKQRPSWQLVP